MTSIKQKKNLTRVIIAAVGLAGGAAYFLSDSNTGSSSETSVQQSSSRPATLVSVKTPEQGSMSVQYRIDGVVEQSMDSVIRASVTARIDSLKVRPGQVVPKGAVLAVLASPEIDEQVRSSRLGLSAAQSTLAQAQRNHERNVELFSKGYIAQVDLESSELNLSNAKAAAAQSNSVFVQAVVQRDRTQIKAPFNAVVSRVLVSDNALVSAGQSLIELSSDEGAELVFNVPQEVQAVGRKIKVNDKLLDVYAADPRFDLGSGTYRAYAKAPNTFVAGLAVSGFLQSEPLQGLIVDSAALVRQGTAVGLMAMNAENKAEFKPVEVLATEDNKTLIKDSDSGLQTLKYISEGANLINAGESLEVAPVALNTLGGA